MYVLSLAERKQRERLLIYGNFIVSPRLGCKLQGRWIVGAFAGAGNWYRCNILLGQVPSMKYYEETHPIRVPIVLARMRNVSL